MTISRNLLISYYLIEEKIHQSREYFKISEFSVQDVSIFANLTYVRFSRFINHDRNIYKYIAIFYLFLLVVTVVFKINLICEFIGCDIRYYYL